MQQNTSSLGKMRDESLWQGVNTMDFGFGQGIRLCGRNSSQERGGRLRKRGKSKGIAEWKSSIEVGASNELGKNQLSLGG